MKKLGGLRQELEAVDAGIAALRQTVERHGGGGWNRQRDLELLKGWNQTLRKAVLDRVAGKTPSPAALRARKAVEGGYNGSFPGWNPLEEVG